MQAYSNEVPKKIQQLSTYKDSYESCASFENESNLNSDQQSKGVCDLAIQNSKIFKQEIAVQDFCLSNMLGSLGGQDFLHT